MAVTASSNPLPAVLSNNLGRHLISGKIPFRVILISVHSNSSTVLLLYTYLPSLVPRNLSTRHAHAAHKGTTKVART